MKPRRGIAIIEVMIAVVVFGVVASLALSLLLTLYQNERLLQTEAAMSYSLSQWEFQLRDDVHAAEEAFVDGKNLVLGSSEEHQVVYSAEPDGIYREVLDPDEDSSVDRLVALSGATASWRTEERDGATWVIAELQPAPQTRLRHAVPFEIRVGRPSATMQEAAP
jgi:prepilin-type N-terminal cleavage/methylation domain-containing protein